MSKNFSVDSKNYYNTVYYGQKKRKFVTFPGLDNRKHIIDYLPIKKGGKFFDVACGTGWLLRAASRRGCDCYGVDFSEKALAAAQQGAKATLFCRDVNAGFPYLDDSEFDYVTCLGSLEHFIKQDFVVKEMARVCKQNGKIMILVPNDDYILHKFGYETDNQPIRNRYGLMDWKNLLENNGCTVIKTIKDNSHLCNLNESSHWTKFLLKLTFCPFTGFIPTRLSYNFIFICAPHKRDADHG